MKSVKSTQGVESAKSTGQGWLARMTKKRWVAVVALSLCFVFCMSFGLQQVLKSKKDGNVDNGKSQIVEPLDVDLSAYADKYIEFFVPNENGTVSLDLSKKARDGKTIEQADAEVMQQYANMLTSINALVADGTLYIADNGEYLMTGQESDLGIEKGWSGGKNDFYIRTESHKVVFFTVTIPVGYTWNMSTSAAIIFGAITAVLKVGVTLLLGGESKAIESILMVCGVVADVASLLDSGWIYSVLYGIFIVGTAIDVAVASTGAGSVIVVAMKVVVAVLGNILFDFFGLNFLAKGINNLSTSNNTVKMESNLLFGNRNFWSVKV
ncbi:MAG: hypothetical protein FWD76_03660 [Firmicutes bacterium]|nr:hypothetical protein [Bacillota bacterium]